MSQTTIQNGAAGGNNVIIGNGNTLTVDAGANASAKTMPLRLTLPPLIRAFQPKQKLKSV